jgi:energy-coupling factor transporter ATP-binding protein EcfA2
MQNLSREDFVNNWFTYYPGEHLNIIGPTGMGKSHLIGQLLGKVNSDRPSIQAIWMVPKAIDPTMSRLAKTLGYKIVRDWPARKPLFGSEPQGYILWPGHITSSAKANNEHLGEVFRNAMNDCLVQQHNILVGDDAYGLAADKKLSPELNRHWTEGRSAESSLWTSLQQPKGTVQGGVSSYAYSQPTHFFFGKDNTQANLEKISNISIPGIDPDYIMSLVSNLRTVKIGASTVSELLYINRSQPAMAKIGIN